MTSDGALNYCEGSAVVLRIIRSTAANESQYYCKWFALMRETTACKPKSKYFGGDFFASKAFCYHCYHLCYHQLFSCNFQPAKCLL